MPRQSLEHQDVLAFFEKFQIPRLTYPDLLDRETFLFRVARLQEELEEFKASHANRDLEGAADALVDLVYIAIGTAICMGLPWDALWEEVQRANMTKRRATSEAESKHGTTLDIVKPDGWKGPDHRKALMICPCCGCRYSGHTCLFCGVTDL